MTKKNVVILGSSGYIGNATLDVISHLSDRFTVFGLSVHQNITRLSHQIRKFRPKLVAITDPAQASKFTPIHGVKVLKGMEGLVELATLPEVDIVVVAVSGTNGLYPTLHAIKAGKSIRIANKETLVGYGELIMPLVHQHNVSFLPIDSEHTGLYQLLNYKDNFKRLILTASGGIFHNRPIEADISPDDVLKHPRWQMGKLITIYSSLMINKGMEVIEAHYLFGVGFDQIDVVIHPEAIIHAMVEFIDNSIIAQLSIPNMRLAIQYALTYPERCTAIVKQLDLTKLTGLHFYPPDDRKFPALRIAYEVGRLKRGYPLVYVVSAEEATKSFLANKLRFTDIPRVITTMVESYHPPPTINLDTLQEVEHQTRHRTTNVIKDIIASYRD